MGCWDSLGGGVDVVGRGGVGRGTVGRDVVVRGAGFRGVEGRGVVGRQLWIQSPKRIYSSTMALG